MLNPIDLHFIFWGTPDVARETLEILKKADFMPSLIITSPDAPQGRGMHVESSPVAKFAEENDIPCMKPEKLDRDFISRLKVEEFDLSIVVAYGKIIPKEILEYPKLGSINIHYSLLPKYRGASPVESAILAGDTVTGISIQQMEYEMDKGPIVAEQELQILPDEKAEALRARLIAQGAELLNFILPDFVLERIKPVIQDESRASYSRKIKKEDGLINFEDDGAKNYNKFRAYAKWPRSFFFKNDKRIIVTDASLVDGKFTILKVLPEGKKEISYIDFLKNNPD